MQVHVGCQTLGFGRAEDQRAIVRRQRSPLPPAPEPGRFVCGSEVHESIATGTLLSEPKGQVKEVDAISCRLKELQQAMWCAAGGYVLDDEGEHLLIGLLSRALSRRRLTPKQLCWQRRTARGDDGTPPVGMHLLDIRQHILRRPWRDRRIHHVVLMPRSCIGMVTPRLPNNWLLGHLSHQRSHARALHRGHSAETAGDAGSTATQYGAQSIRRIRQYGARCI
mmetsp:Transcript_53971/g.126634  ORF Transcript_53971/g.126634 Transcript_53971/m.126634 type:complete len:223 (+) Transcript_53971:380-1048(+)